VLSRRSRPAWPPAGVLPGRHRGTGRARGRAELLPSDEHAVAPAGDEPGVRPTDPRQHLRRGRLDHQDPLRGGRPGHPRRDGDGRHGVGDLRVLREAHRPRRPATTRPRVALPLRVHRLRGLARDRAMVGPRAE
jgi:hypothetical protein